MIRQYGQARKKFFIPAVWVVASFLFLLLPAFSRMYILASGLQTALPESSETSLTSQETAPTLVILSSEADRDYILFLFLDLLEREPTEAETTDFIKKLDTGKIREDLQDEIFESQEFKARLKAMDEAFNSKNLDGENVQPLNGGSDNDL